MTILKQTLGELSTITNKQMNDYSLPQYKGLYEEILKDYNYRWGKFSPIPYPLLNRIQHHEQQRTQQITRTKY